MDNVPPAGWYADPSVPGQQRYWDGARWTEHTAPAVAPPPAPQAPAPAAPQPQQPPSATAPYAAPAAPGAQTPPPTSPYAAMAPGYLPTAGERVARGLTVPERVSAVSILVVLLASFLPWASFAGFTAWGLEGDGVITLVLGLAGAVLLAINTGLIGGARRTGPGLPITLLVVASLVALVGLIDMNGLASIGLYLTFLGGVAWVVGAVWQLVQRSKTGA